MSATKQPNPIPDSIARIPVQMMVKAELEKLLKLSQRMLDGINELRKSTPQLDGAYDYALRLWQRAHTELERRKLLAAERADKGRVLWEIFSPRSKTPLNISIWDQQRHVVRTPHRKIVYGEYFTIKAEWKVTETDPWTDFAVEQRRQPLDLVAFAQYARDVDECIRRKLARDGSLERQVAA